MQQVFTIPLRYFIALAVCLKCGSCAAARDSELSSALQELTAILRGLRSDITSNFEKLLSDLHQDRLARTELNLALRDQVEENRLSIEMLRSQVASMAKGSGCPVNMEILAGVGRKPGNGGGGGGGTGGGGGGGTGGAVARGKVADNRRSDNSYQRGSETANPQDSGEANQQNSREQSSNVVECPPPFKRAGKHCLIVLKERTPWETARAHCHTYVQRHARKLGSSQVNGDLVVPHDMEAFREFIENADFSGKAWVGASTEGWGGVWAWIDGSLIKELPWLYAESGLSGGLLAVDKNFTFHTVQHRQSLFPVCELT